MHAGSVEDHKGLAMTVESAIAGGQAAMATAGKARAAKDRRERLERGEDIPGGIGKPMTWKDTLADLGLSESAARRAVAIASLSEVEFDEMKAQVHEATRRAENAAVRAVCFGVPPLVDDDDPVGERDDDDPVGERIVTIAAPHCARRRRDRCRGARGAHRNRKRSGVGARNQTSKGRSRTVDNKAGTDPI